MQVQECPIGKIHPYFKNAKEHKDKQIKKIADSIREFGFNQPIVVDVTDTIIVGHGRYLAALALGMESVPVLRVDLDEEKAKAYRLADNKLNESEWDMDLVIEELKTLSVQMIDLTGFNANLILETKEDKPDLSSVGKPRSVIGDVYELGGVHKLICGDSTDENTYRKLLGDERPRLVFTDPPYSVDYESTQGTGHGRTYSYASEKFGGTGGRIFNDDKTPDEALIFYKDILKQIYQFTADDVTLYWWFASRLFDINKRAMVEMGWHYSQIVIWLKNSLVFAYGQLYHRIYEPCMIGWKEGKTPYRDYVFSAYSDLWQLELKTFAEHLDVWYQKRDNTNTYVHPTQKPVQLAERALKRSSDKGDIVLDAFGGSGSTLIACDQLERKARLIELDPKYVDVIVTRWCKYKNIKTVTKNGETFEWMI